MDVIVRPSASILRKKLRNNYHERFLRESLWAEKWADFSYQTWQRLFVMFDRCFLKRIVETYLRFRKMHFNVFFYFKRIKR